MSAGSRGQECGAPLGALKLTLDTPLEPAYANGLRRWRLKSGLHQRFSRHVQLAGGAS